MARDGASRDPLGRTIQARWLVRTTATGGPSSRWPRRPGLSRVAAAERDAVAATLASAPASCSAPRSTRAPGRSILGIGGSATTDGGAGLLARARRRRRTAIAPRVDLGRPGSAARAASTLAVACDVSNPLLGPSGAAAIYGPQKGASPADVAELDRRLAAWADALEAATGARRPRHAGRRRRGRRRLRAARDRRTASASFALRPGRRPGDGGDRLRRPGSPAPTSSSPARAGSTPRPRSARPRSASRGGRPAAGVPCIAVGGGVEPDGIDGARGRRGRRRPGRRAPAVGRGGDGGRRRRRSSAAASGSRGSSRSSLSRSPSSRPP